MSRFLPLCLSSPSLTLLLCKISFLSTGLEHRLGLQSQFFSNVTYQSLTLSLMPNVFLKFQIAVDLNCYVRKWSFLHPVFLDIVKAKYYLNCHNCLSGFSVSCLNLLSLKFLFFKSL